MKHTSDGNKRIYEFSDIIDFVDFVKDVPSNYRSKKKGDNDWSGGSFDDAVTQAYTGNPELVSKIFDGANIISAMIDEERKGEIRDVVGEYFDVGDFLSGEPEVFRRDEYGPRKPVIPVYASFAMHCGIGNDTIKNRGCSIVAICDELCSSGFIVDLNLVHCVRYDGKRYYTKIHVRVDPLDLDTVAFIIANPLCLRRLWLAAMELYTDNPNPGGHGAPDEYDLDDIFSSGVSGFYFVGSSHSEFSQGSYRDLKKAKNHIIGMIEKFKDNPCQVILG